MDYKKVKQSLYHAESHRRYALKDPTSCPNCGVAASGYSELIEKFGLRTMHDGITRVQSWCRDCRSFRFSNKRN